MSPATTQSREPSDAQIRAMLEAFAGPATPVRPDLAARRRPTRRTTILVVAGLVALGLAVPGALALLGYWETPRQFLVDRNQPEYAKRMVRSWLKRYGYVEHGPHGYFPFRLVALTKGVTVRTPDGEVRMYGLRLAHNPRGFIVVPAAKGDDFLWSLTVPTTAFLVPSAVPGPEPTPGRKIVYRPCSRGWALQYLLSSANAQGGWPPIGRQRAFAYTIGRASSKVASVHVLYRDGSTTKSAVAAGYFLAWIKPAAFETNVTLIAEDAAGKTIGRLVIAWWGGPPVSWRNLGPPFPCAH